MRADADAPLPCLAQDMHFLLHWLLHSCWGMDVVRQCLDNDAFGSSKEALNPSETRLILFLAAVGVIPGAAKHLSHVLHRRSWFAVSAKRRGLGSTHDGQMHLSSGGLVASDVNRVRLRRLTEAFLGFEVPCCCFAVSE
ncbi:methyltransferase type 12 [Trypanosoma conorhini]|uniref:Methyltransferase type 12 n=1 Tax=Trypanosoma conorhini TaxID=83891 RepID=A0A422NI57_9TRYP|nr:methyltransferase type 12 [Trypanosoma conorhini]RNF05168.1 methyltransferase type 12 [Trypanosoma conorhini]